MIADGTVSCIVEEILADGVIVTVKNSAVIGERKNVNLPGAKIDIPTVTEKDSHDITDFALKYDVDMISLSFTRSSEDIRMVR